MKRILRVIDIDANVSAGEIYRRAIRLQVQLPFATLGKRELITGGPGWIPDQGQLYDFETLWRYDGDDWKLASADWNPCHLTKYCR